jgi:hypothetical protein
VSPTTAAPSLREQLRPASAVEVLQDRSRRVPHLVGNCIVRGLPSSRAIMVDSALVVPAVRARVAVDERQAHLIVDIPMLIVAIRELPRTAAEGERGLAERFSP